jgi:phosphatidylethanolamine-binding protein (PEBP) family uncharacterized protein
VLTLASLAASIVISAPWANGTTIPARYTCDGGNARPAISWHYVYGWSGSTPAPRPVDVVTLVDLDARPAPFVHWLLAGKTPGRNSFGRLGWAGPCPPRRDRPHRYVLRVEAVRGPLSLRAGFTFAELRRVISGRVVASGTLVGRYGR